MKKIVLAFYLVSLFAPFSVAQQGDIDQPVRDYADQTFRIFGKVTYFDGAPVENADVNIRHEKTFWIAYATLTNSKGEYEMRVKRGKYLAMYACRDYGTKNLEYWAWNLVVDRDLEINARIDGLEIYAMNAFKIQGSRGFLLYFRPMSLQRQKDTGLSREEREKLPLIDQAPRLKVEDVEIKINGQIVDIWGLTMIEEKSSKDTAIYAYIAWPQLPQDWQQYKVLRIDITAIDTETGEQGENTLFWENPFYNPAQ